MRVFGTLRFKLTTLITALSLILVVFASLYFLQSINVDQQTKMFRLRTAASEHLNQATAIQATERGVGNTIIGGNPDLIGLFKDLGVKGDARVRAAETAINNLLKQGWGSSDFEDKFADWKRDYKTLRQIRSRVGRGNISSQMWLATANRNILNEFDLRDQIFTPLNESEAILYYNTVLQPNIATFAEFAGRERALIGHAVASGWAIPPEMVAELKRYRSRVDMAIRQIMLLKGHSTTPPELQKVIENFEKTFLDTFERLRQKIYSVSIKTSDLVKSTQVRLDKEKGVILNVLRGIEDELTGLNDNPYLKKQVRRLINSKEADFSRVKYVFEDLNDVHHKYNQVRYLDASGRERVRIDHIGGRNQNVISDRLQDKGGRYYFVESKDLPQGKIYLSPLDLNIEGGQIETPFKPMLRYAMPVFVDGQRHGIVVLNFLASRFLDELPKNIPLVNSDGFYLHHEDASKEWGMMTGLNRKSSNLYLDHPKVASTFMSGESDKIIIKDTAYIARRINYGDSKRFWLLIASVKSTPYPVDSTLWIKKATDAIDTALAISDTVGKMAILTIEKRENTVNLERSLLAVLALFLAATLVWFFRELILAGRKTRRVLSGLRNFASGDLSHRIDFQKNGINRNADLRPNNEIDAISMNINLMAESLGQSMASLSESEQRFRDFAAAAADRFWETNAEFQYTYISSPKRNLTNPESNLLGNTPWEVAGSDENQPGLKEIKQKFEKHLPVDNIEYNWINDAGQARHLGVSAIPHHDENGNFKGYRGVSIDKTHERHAQKLYRQLFEQANDGILLRTNDTWEVIDCNEALAANLGYTREELIGETIGMFSPLPRGSSRDHRILGLPPGENDAVERVHRRKDGTEFPVEVSSASIDVEGRKLTLSFFRDITERKRAETELRKLSQAVEQSSAVVVITDTNATIEYVNPKFEEITGYSAEEAIGQNPRFLKSGQTPAATYKDLWKTISSGKEWRGEFRNKRKDGRLFWESVLISPIKSPDGTITNYLAIEEDVTDRKNLEDQLRQAQKMEAVGQLTGGVAHDFNNLLAIMMGNSELLGDEINFNENAQHHLDEIKQAVKNAASLTNRLLAFSRKQILVSKATDLRGIIDGLDNMLHRTLGETIELRAEHAPDLWSAMIDPHQFENALVNLAVNARDAMPKGGALTIETTNVTLDEAYAEQHEEVMSGDYVRVAVSDTGTGMIPEVLEKVFEPFFTTKDVGKGSGLGLSMVYGFVKQSDGHIAIYSEVDHGTIIELYFPRSRETLTEEEANVDVSEFELGSERILIVEDDLDVRKVSVSILQKQGYEIVEAKDGKEAIDILKNNQPFDLLFTDVVLPGGMNGVEIAEEAKRLQPDIKVLYTSGYAENAVKHSGKLILGETLVNKPYLRAELLEKVRAVLEN